MLCYLCAQFHIFTEHRSNRRHWYWPFLPEHFECRALQEALTLIHHTARPVCPAYVKHKHPFRQLESSIAATHTQSPAFEGHHRAVTTAELKVSTNADQNMSCFKGPACLKKSLFLTSSCKKIYYE